MIGDHSEKSATLKRVQAGRSFLGCHFDSLLIPLSIDNNPLIVCFHVLVDCDLRFISPVFILGYF
jgi:hypothetical protein